MTKAIEKSGIFLFLIFVFTPLSFAEDITITTYYPSPYGSYRDVRAQHMGIGDTYSDPSQYYWTDGGTPGNVDDSTSLIVEGNVGMGTTTPQSPAPNNQPGNLDVNDVYLRSTGQWVSQGSGITCATYENSCDATLCDVSCPAGWTATGGGYQTFYGENMDQSGPNGNGWRVQDESWVPGVPLTVRVICCQ